MAPPSQAAEAHLPVPAGKDTRDDDALMYAYKEGDPSAFQTLVKRHQKPLYRFCLRSLGSAEAAADAAQEVFLRVVKHAPKWERKAKFTTWMYTIARNFCIDEARKGRFRHTDSLNEPLSREDEAGAEKIDRVEDEGPSSDRLTDSKRIRQVVDSCLEEMRTDQREVFWARPDKARSCPPVS